MPASQRAALLSPISPTPRRGPIAQLAHLPSLDPLRVYRSSESLPSSDGETDVEDHTSLVIHEPTDDNEHAAVEVLVHSALGSPATPPSKRFKRDEKGKSVDPREYGSASRRIRPGRVLQPNLPKDTKNFPPHLRVTSNMNLLDPRRIVSPTASVYGIINGIDSLGTDEQEEQEVSHMMEDYDPMASESEDVTPPPTSPSPEAMSDTDTDDSPKPSSSRRKVLTKKRGVHKHKQHAAYEHSKEKKRLKKKKAGLREATPEVNSEADRAAAMRALRTFAAEAGYKLVPMSPVAVTSNELQLQFSPAPPIAAVPYTAEPIVPDDSEQVVVSVIPSVATVEPTVAEPAADADFTPIAVTVDTSCPPVTPQRSVPVEPTTIPSIAIVDSSPLPSVAPRRRTAARPVTARPEASRARQQYGTLIPKAATPHHQPATARPRSVQTSNLHRTSPTSINPSRDRLRSTPRKTATRTPSRRPVVLQRPKVPSTFSGTWNAAAQSAPVLPGALYAAVLNDNAARHRMRANQLRRYRERTAMPPSASAVARPAESATPQTGGMPPSRRVISSNSRCRQRSQSMVSESEDAQVEALLRSEDVEMMDSEAVDRFLSEKQRPSKRFASRDSEESDHRRATHSAALTELAAAVSSRHAKRKAERKAAKASAAQRKRDAVSAALVAEEERLTEEADLARVAAEWQAELARQAAAAAADAEARAAAAAEADHEASGAAAVAARVQAWNAHSRNRRERRDVINRRRAADSVAAQLSTRPRTRLGRIPSMSQAGVHERVVRPRMEEQAEVYAEVRAEAQVEAQVEEQVSIQVNQAEPPVEEQVEHLVAPGLLSPVQLATPIPQSPTFSDISAPPEYEYPFFPVIRAAPPVHLRHSPRTRRATSSTVAPPAYAPSAYSRRSPSPPPPYNALTDCRTVVSAVFRERRASVQWDHARRPGPSRRPEAVAMWQARADEADVEMQVEAQVEDDSFEDSFEEDWSSDESVNDGRPIIGTLRRWLGW